MVTRRPSVRFGQFAFDPERLELVRAGEPVRLEPEPARLLELLVDHPGVMVTRQQIHEHVFGDHIPFSDSAIMICVRSLRRTLGDSDEAPGHVQEAGEEGFRFAEPVTPIAAEPVAAPEAEAAAAPRSRPREPEPVAASVAMVLVGALLSLLLLAAIWWLGS